MKKNVMMRVASVLLVAVMLTTCVISGTFAKYVTDNEATDTATVAKFGVNVTVTAETFNDTYLGVEAGWTAKNTVDGKGSNLVAPGTQGEAIGVALTGSPEVAVRVTYNADLELGDYWLADTDNDGVVDDFYCPIIFIINGTEYSAEGVGAADADAYEAFIEAKIAESNKEYEPNTNLATVSGDYVNVSWKWEFHISDDYDEFDTDLGDAANMATIDLKLNVAVTQID